MPASVAQGVLDTSVVIDLDSIPEDHLPTESTITSVTVAEMSAGLHTVTDPVDRPVERATRAGRLQRAEAAWEPLPFGTESARRYGQMVALVVAAGRSHRPRRLDLMIAATASDHELPLFVGNPDDFRGLEASVTVIGV